MCTTALLQRGLERFVKLNAHTRLLLEWQDTIRCRCMRTIEDDGLIRCEACHVRAHPNRSLVDAQKYLLGLQLVRLARWNIM